jgi:hypothetical protein
MRNYIAVWIRARPGLRIAVSCEGAHAATFYPRDGQCPAWEDFRVGVARTGGRLVVIDETGTSQVVVGSVGELQP